ncbi:MAG TPA: LPS export ABC transporter periplasmic protein LptC [Rhizomicrobium sp.]|nr:LPS export ABC transporter periplasmic protein LptC [Rhizomicrobium sp.]
MADRRAVTGAVAEPIGKTPPARGRFDWSARSRSTVDDAERYSRFVSIMRRGLLLAGLLLIGLVIGYSILPRQSQRLAMTFEKMGIVANDLSMIKPKLHGTDSEGNPFTVTADKATQNPKDLRKATLTNVEADLSLKDGQWLNATAPHGVLDADARQLMLSGAIAVFTDQGYEMHTDLAHIDLAKGVAVGPHRVTGQGPAGTFVADRFRIERLTDPCARGKKLDGQGNAKAHKPGGAAGIVCPANAPNAPVQRSKPLIYLIGNVHMQIYPGATKKKS